MNSFFSETSNLIDPEKAGEKEKNYYSFNQQKYLSSDMMETQASNGKTFLSSLSKVFFNPKIFTGLIILSIALERLFFKLLVDSYYPSSFLLIELVFLVSFFIFSLIVLYEENFTDNITNHMKKIPQSMIMKIAFLESIQLIWLFFSAYGTSAPLTVILMQSSTISVVYGSKYIIGDRKYKDLHYQGVIYMIIAIVLALIVEIGLNFLFSQKKISALFPVSFLFASLFSGFVTIYKEKLLIEWSQPINIHFLSSCMFFYQALITFLISLFFYFLQGKELYLF